MSLTKQLERDIKLGTLDFPEWKTNSTAYVFSVKPTSDPEPGAKLEWMFDTWIKVDYSKLEETERSISSIKLRARFTMAHVYAVWLPNELAESLNELDNPEDHFDLIMKYKFKI